MQVLAIIVISFFLIRFLISLANLFTWPHLKNTSRKYADRVSLLIPVRNEEHNVEKLLRMLGKIKYDKLDIIICDDHSEDRSHELLKHGEGMFPNLKVIAGEPLPRGWLGKNWTCHQLSKQAKGKYLLFIDADVSLHPNAIHAGIREMENKNLALLSIFPDQKMHSIAEKLIVPLMHFILLNLLPLRLVSLSRKPSLSAANGQFMLFKSNTYNNWHEQVKNKITEDIDIMRGIKRSGLRGEVLLGGNLIQCRMYTSFMEGLNGFTKNILSGFGNSYALLLLYIGLISFGYIPVFLYFGNRLILVITAGILINRVILSILSHQQPVMNAILHPAQLLLLILIAFRSVAFNILGMIMWKGRRMNNYKLKMNSL